MSITETNLIDLSTSSDDMLIDTQSGTSTDNIWNSDLFPLTDDCLVSGRDSIDNNPFDNVEKLLNNPFEALTYDATHNIQETDNKVIQSFNLITLDDQPKTSVPSPIMLNPEKYSNISTPSLAFESSFNLLSPMDMSLINSSTTTDTDLSGKFFLNSPVFESTTTLKKNQQTLKSEKIKLRNQSESDIIKSKLDKKFKCRSSSLDDNQIAPIIAQSSNSKRTQLLKLSLANSPLINTNTLADDSFEDNMIMNCNPKLIDSEPESDTDPEMKQFSIPFLKTIENEEKKISPNNRLNQCLDNLERIKKCKIDQEIPSDRNIHYWIEILKTKMMQSEDSEKQKLLTNIQTMIVEDNMNLDNMDEIHTPPPIIRQGTFEVDKSDNIFGSAENKKKSETVTFNPNVSYSSTKPFRSKSLSLKEKPISVVRAVQNKQDHKRNSNISTAAVTPIKSMLRRSSFSTPSRESYQPNYTRKSINPQAVTPAKNLSLERSQQQQQQQQLQPKSIPAKKLLKIGDMDFSKKIRSKAPTNTATQQKTGPLRAINPAICTNKFLKTPPNSSSQIYKAPGSSVRSTTTKLAISPGVKQAKSRLSYASATPNPKSNKMIASGNRRRSVSDYRNHTENKSTLLTPGKMDPSKFLSKMQEMCANGTIYTRNKENKNK